MKKKSIIQHLPITLSSVTRENPALKPKEIQIKQENVEEANDSTWNVREGRKICPKRKWQTSGAVGSWITVSAFLGKLWQVWNNQNQRSY